MMGIGEFLITLTLVDGSDDLTSRVLKLTPEEPVSIGRSSRAPAKQLVPNHDNAFINNPVISRNHATLISVVVPDLSYHVVRIQDKGSMHGTFVNGSKLPVNEARTIITDDVIRFGANVTRGRDLYKAPEFRFRIEKPDQLVTETSAHAAPLSVPSIREVGIPFKGGYCVPESDSSPAPSCIGDDYDSDIIDDGDDSHSSVQAADFTCSQKSRIPDVIEGKFMPMIDLLNSDSVKVSARKIIRPMAIIDKTSNFIILDDGPSAPSDSEAHSDVDQSEDDADILADEEGEEEEEEEEDQDEIFGYDELSDDDKDDTESAFEKALSVGELRDSSTESDDGPAVKNACRFIAALPVQHFGDALCNDDAFSTESIASESGHQEPVEAATFSEKATEQGASVRRMEIDALLNDTHPETNDEGLGQDAVEHLMSRHPCDVQTVSGAPYDLPNSRRMFPFELPTPQPAFGFDRAPTEAPATSPALAFGFKLPPPTHFPTYPNMGEPSNPGAFDSPPMPAMEHREEVTDCWRGLTYQDIPPSLSWPNERVSELQTANATALSMADGSKKRSFDVFEGDLIGETEQESSAVPSSTAHNSEIPGPPAQAAATEGAAAAAIPSTTSPISQHPKVEAVPVHEPSPPRKRARLHSAAKTAGTVLASALAGGVATFYALGLAPESLFA